MEPARGWDPRRRRATRPERLGGLKAGGRSRSPKAGVDDLWIGSARAVGAGCGGVAGGPQAKHDECDVNRQPDQHCGDGKMNHCQTSLRGLDNSPRLPWFRLAGRESSAGSECCQEGTDGKTVVRDEPLPRLALLPRLRLQRKAKPQSHALDRVRRASENLRCLFQRSRRLRQLHEPAVFLKRPGLARHNRNDPLVDTTTKPPSDPCSLDGFAWVGPGLGEPGAKMDMRSARLRNKQRGLS